MDREQLQAYLKENLSISLSEGRNGHGPGSGPTIRVSLMLDDVEISYDILDLPERD